MDTSRPTLLNKLSLDIRDEVLPVLSSPVVVSICPRSPKNVAKLAYPAPRPREVSITTSPIRLIVRMESSTVPIGTPRIVGPLYVTGAAVLVEFAMLVSVSVAAASRAAVSFCAATVLDALVVVARLVAFSLSIAVTFKSGRSSFVAVLKLSTLPVLGFNHSNVLFAPSSVRASAYASLKLLLFLIVSRTSLFAVFLSIAPCRLPNSVSTAVAPVTVSLPVPPATVCKMLFVSLVIAPGVVALSVIDETISLVARFEATVSLPVAPVTVSVVVLVSVVTLVSVPVSLVPLASAIAELAAAIAVLTAI